MWIIILSLLAVGLALVIVEIIFVPGTTIVGILGVVLAGTGIILTYREYGAETGNYVLVGMALVTALVLYLSFRSDAWSRFANKSAIQSRVNEGAIASLREGDEGISLSTLKPIGKAQFGNSQHEVKTVGDYVDVGTRVKIIRIQSNQIIVKPLT